MVFRHCSCALSVVCKRSMVSLCVYAGMLPAGLGVAENENWPFAD